VGFKTKNGEKTEELCLIIGVKEKKPISALAKKDIIPEIVDGITTDVIEIGTPVAQVSPTLKHRPVFPGISIGHYLITAGTFGCIVNRNGNKYILSNNHVLANSNEANQGDPIYQPGVYDGGNDSCTAAKLDSWVPINFEGESPIPNPPTCPIAKVIVKILNAVAQKIGSQHRFLATKQRTSHAYASSINYVDAALAEPVVAFDEEIAQIGKPEGIKSAELGMMLQKYGRTTEYTTGTVLQLNATIQVSYGTNQVATFEGRILTDNMSAGGDSGSAVLDMENNLIGLLFAGSDTITILNPMEKVFSLLSLSL